ncbi:hypothetical protein [Meiothermus hypogaeus]|uniref:Uncharacterized protein n=2 Tax=Meiothermus hypogaeus TaxID=884155 RepID=A0A511QY19_9DEIN|nr:hypothetical protein [Meiothermus hypogaeus]RIH79230.1 hypothetical protein Mhypo_01228 [Meiothermus hypogaeus]GEM81877.1 hypothetical protein MHY01S_00430 [Meiothermus hypogaeus NBRC 106114]
MNTAISKLLPYSESGIVSRHSDDTLIISGFRNDINLEALQAEIEAEWLELAKEEAAIQIKNALTAAQESRRPANFSDLTVKLQLGRITPAEREQLNAYYDALDELEREAKALLQKLEKAESVEVVNKIPWPEWVGWEALPLRLKLEVEQTYPEASNK